LNNEEEWYWSSQDYRFRLNTGKDYKHTIAVMCLTNLNTELPVKVIMFKYLDTLLKFKRDFRHIVMMLKYRGCDKIEITKQMKRVYGKYAE